MCAKVGTMSLSITDLFELPIQALTPASPITVEAGSPLTIAVHELQTHRIGCVLVVRRKRLVGVLSERDLAQKVLGRDIDIEVTPVDSVMTPEPESLGLNDSVAYALNRMNLGGYRHVPIVGADNIPIGIISVKDIVNLLVDEFPNAIMNLPPEPRVYPTTREGA